MALEYLPLRVGESDCSEKKGPAHANEPTLRMVALSRRLMCPHRFSRYGKPFHIRVKRKLGRDEPQPHVCEILPVHLLGKILAHQQHRRSSCSSQTGAAS